MKGKCVSLIKRATFVFQGILLGCVLCICFAGCESKEYQQANELYSNGDYDAALMIYNDLGEYRNSAEKAIDCEFLITLKESVLNRMENADFERSILVQTELAYLESFIDCAFYDSELRSIATLYIEGLYAQRKALESEYEWEYQLEWQRGLVYRCKALKQLYNNYDFLSDNKNFIGTYVAQYEQEETVLRAYEAINADIDMQIEAGEIIHSLDGNVFSFIVKNNTNYTYTTVFDITFSDENNTVLENNSAYIANIKPQNSYVVSFYLSSDTLKANYLNFEWNNYYVDVSSNEMQTMDNATTKTIAEQTYNEMMNLTIYDCTLNSLGQYEYKGLVLIDDSINHNETIQASAVYQKMAMCLKGFELGNSWDTYAPVILRETPKNRAEFAAYVEELSSYIVENQAANYIRSKFQIMDTVEVNEKDKVYKIDIPNLIETAKELNINDEMMGHLICAFHDSGATISFEGKGCKIEYKDYWSD